MDPRAVAVAQALDTHGAKPAGADLETVEKILTYVASYAASATLTDQTMTLADNKPQQYKTEPFPSNGAAYTITGLQGDPSLQFTQSTIGASVLQYYFEKYSRVILYKDERPVLEVPVSAILPWTTRWLGTTVAVDPKRNSWYALQPKSAIKVAAGERFSAKLIVATNLTLSATTTATTPYLPGLGLSADQGYAFTLNLRAHFHRKA